MSLIPITKTTNKKRYFTQETEDAIIEYNKTENFFEKSKIYERKIHYPFFKLTENIIHTFKFYHTEEEDLENLQHELMIFLLSKIHLYDHKKNIEDKFKKIIIKEFKEQYTLNFEEYVGNVNRISQKQINDFIDLLNVSKECKDTLFKIIPPKAYSYFGTIVKRWLILYNQKNYKKKLVTSPIDELNPDEILLEVSPSKEKLYIFIEEYIKYCSDNIYTLFPDINEAKVADAIIELFRKRNHLTIFNKKALNIYIREIIDVKTSKITKISKTLSKIFKKSYTNYINTGILKFE
jgi:hypothetical protein